MNTQSQSNKPVSVVDFLAIIRRRILWGLLVVVLVAAGFSTYMYVAKDWFRARTLMAIEPSSQPDTTYVDPATRVQRQVRTVREVLFSDSVFKPVVKEFNLLSGTADSPQRAMEEVRDSIKIELDGDTNFYVGFESTDRKQASDVANRLAELLSVQTSVRREQRNEQESRVIDSEIAQLRQRLGGINTRIQRYKESAVEELPERIDANLKFLETLQAQIQETSRELSIEEAKRAGVISEMSEIDKQGMLEDRTPPPRSANAEKLDAAKYELDKLMARGYTNEHFQVRTIQNEVATLQALVNAEKPVIIKTVSPAQLRYTELKAEIDVIDRRTDSLRQERAALSEQLSSYQQRVNSSPRHEQALGQLKRDYDIASNQYEAQLTKQAEERRRTEIAEIDHGLVFRIVEPAKPPLDPFAPNRLRLVLMAIAIALGGGLAAIFLAEQIDSTFKDIEEFQSQTGLPVLTIIPKIKDTTKAPKPQKGAIKTATQPQNSIVTLLNPLSVSAEQFQVLAARLRRRRKGSFCSVLTVTSAAGGEGKTLNAVNLAVALSSSGASVLLIDADLRRPRVHQALGIKPTEAQGIVPLLSDETIDLAKRGVDVAGLTVLPTKGSVKNSLALLASTKFSALIDRLRSQFQFIVIDSPPIIPIADSMVLGGVSDQVVLVVRARQTTRAVFQRALESIDSTKLAGVILNDVDMKHSKYSHVYRYYENTYLRGA